MEIELYISTESGYCFYELESVYFNGRPLIYNLYVYPECRRRGEAKKLLQLVIKSIRLSGCYKKIVAEVKPRENSISVDRLIAFYESLGVECFYDTAIVQEEIFI